MGLLNGFDEPPYHHFASTARYMSEITTVRGLFIVVKPTMTFSLRCID
jgi:hypothetical protein